MIDNRNAKIIAFALVAVLLLIGTVGIASVAICSAVGYESDLPIIYDNWNPDACDTTDTSIWSLDKDTRIYEIAIWYKDWPSEGTVSYVIEKDGMEFRKGYFMKGACHHKYTYWCDGSDTLNMVFPTGTYVMKLSGSNQCQNSGSNGNGFVKLLGPTPTYETPTGYWNFNEGSGNVAYDSSGSDNDGTIHGATWVDNGSCKKALSFDGVDDYVQTDPATFQSNDITVEAWIYPKSFSSYKTILHKGDRRGANNFLFTFDLISNKISFFISSNGNTFNSVIGTTNLELNKWCHVVGVYRSRDKFFAVYVNGTEDNSKTSTLSSLYHDASKYWIGARYDNRQFLSDRYFNGIIDEIRIYNRALTETEIQSRYKTGSAPAFPPTITTTPTVTPSTPAPAPPSGGGVHSIHSYNYPDHFIRHRNYLGEITKIVSTLDKKDATFKLVPGLADSRYVSFESVNYPGYYLRHQNYRIKLHKKTDDELFNKGSTFKIVPGLADSSWVSFESYNYPGYFIRHKSGHLYIEKGDTDLFRKDTTFKLVTPEYQPAEETPTPIVIDAFRESARKCEPAEMTLVLDDNMEIFYRIEGEKDGYCVLYEKVVRDNTGYGFVGKDMTCNIPIDAVREDTPLPEDFNIKDYCDGPLADVIVERGKEIKGER